MKKINIGIIGLGTVGCGVVKTLKNFSQINIVKIGVKNKNKKRNIEDLDENLITCDAYEIVNNPKIDIVVEVAGGVNPTYDLIKTALSNGKHIVTANKELLAKHGDELFKIANEKKLIILYEAAIAGGIPIIMPLKMTLCGNKICNYWLYVIWQYTDCNYSNIEMLTVAPDTHVIKSTYHLGLINKEEFESNNVQEIVIEKWNKLFEGTKYKPIDIHTALWLWSRNGFKDLEYYNCLEKVLKTTKEISKNSKYIHINLKAIKNLHLNTSKVGHWLSSNPYGILDLNIEDIVNFLIMYDAIDCCFWGNPKWTIKDSHGNNIDGAFALLYALLKLYKDQGHLNFELITFEKFKDHLKGNIDIPLLKERYQILQKISAVINQKMNGNFYQYIRNIKEDIKLIHIVVNNFSSFTDVRTYNNQTVYFYKLAQLVTSDILHIRSLKENIEVDCSHLVGCADYKIPQVLRGLGVLEYNSELQNIVDNKREIVENSDYEIEIRANTIVAINLIKNELNNKFDAITINDIIWYAGQDKTKNFKPYHLTKTLSY